MLGIYRRATTQDQVMHSPVKVNGRAGDGIIDDVVNREIQERQDPLDGRVLHGMEHMTIHPDATARVEAKRIARPCPRSKGTC